jgi:hypothetical protein
MSLRTQIEELRGARPIIRPPQLPAKLQMDEALGRAAARHDQPSKIDKIEYEALRAKLHGGAAVASLTSRDLRLAATCLFDGEKPLIDDAAFLRQYLGALRSIRSRNAVRRLIGAYMLHFDPKRAGIREISYFLSEAVSSINSRWEWPRRHREFKLFDPEQVASHLFGLTKNSAAPRQELARAGLVGTLGTGKLAGYVFLEALNSARAELEAKGSTELVNKLTAWIRGEDGRLHFTEHRNIFANTLLLPWVTTDPDHLLREKIQNCLLEILGDPRINNPAWVRSDDAARAVITRWLAKATLEQFLKVVDRVAAKHQWEYRRAFWGAYMDRQFVSNSWVAFGAEGASVARGLSETSGDNLMRQFASLGKAAADQAVLLLQIDNLVIADWSHNGKLRIWQRGNRRAPAFGATGYIASQLRSEPEFETAHLPPNGWQVKTESYIRHHTGIKLSQVDYMPRRRGS